MARSVVVALAFSGYAAAQYECIAPGTCVAPHSQYSVVPRGPQPGQQWNINGGFCGAFSIQQSTLAFGAWISQDLVRKANKDQEGPKFMHGDTEEGYEVVPSNVAYTAEHLKLKYDEWDYEQPLPQSDAYKSWMKSHLVKAEPVVWFPMCKGDSTRCYPFSCPGVPRGSMDHVEPIYGIFTNHSLDDLTVYDDDVILHMSDQDLMPYYRAMSTLQDSEDMDGNCADAQPGFGYNEMYPCFDEQRTYGLSVMGLNVSGDASVLLLQTSITVGITYEPNVRDGEDPVPIAPIVQVVGFSDQLIASGGNFTIYRYDDIDSVPTTPPFTNYAQKVIATLNPGDEKYLYQETSPFMSDTAAYYIATDESS